MPQRPRHRCAVCGESTRHGPEADRCGRCRQHNVARERELPGELVLEIERRIERYTERAALGLPLFER